MRDEKENKEEERENRHRDREAELLEDVIIENFLIIN